MPAIHPRLRALLGAAALLASAHGACADTLPGAPPAPPPVMAATPKYSEEELRLIYDEAVATGGPTYVFYIMGSDDRDAIQDILSRLDDPQNKGATLKAALKQEPRKQQTFALPVVIRDQLRKLSPGEHSGIFPLDKRNWAIVELDSIDATTPVPVFESLRNALPKLVSTGAIPEPRLLANDPDLRMRSLMNKADTTAAFDRLPPGFDIDMPLSSGFTLLQRALVRDDPAMVRATLLRAANTNLCLMRNCPLHLAVRSKAHGGEYVAQLVAGGAKPDLSTQPGEDSALTLATSLGNLEAVRQLLASGANPHGADGPNTPLGVAAYMGHTDIVQLLLQKGADPLFRKTARTGAGFTTPLSTAIAGQRGDAIALLRNATRKQLAARKPYRWSVWIEQDGKKLPVSGNRVRLARKPFTLNVRMAPGAELRLEASTSPKLFDEYTGGDFKAPLYQLSRQYSELHDGSARALLVSDFAARSAGAAQHGGVQAWSWGGGRKDFNRVDRDKDDKGNPVGAPYLVREIDALILDNGDGRTEVPLAKSRLREIDLLIGIGVDYSPAIGDFANARRLRLVFDR